MMQANTGVFTKVSVTSLGIPVARGVGLQFKDVLRVTLEPFMKVALRTTYRQALVIISYLSII